jgi:hypothetical protein
LCAPVSVRCLRGFTPSEELPVFTTAQEYLVT